LISLMINLLELLMMTIKKGFKKPFQPCIKRVTSTKIPILVTTVSLVRPFSLKHNWLTMNFVLTVVKAPQSLKRRATSLNSLHMKINC